MPFGLKSSRQELILQTLIVSLGVLQTASGLASNVGRGVYGDDHRQDIYELLEGPPRRTIAASVAIIRRNRLVETGSSFRIKDSSLRNDLKLCTGERYRNQLSIGSCSGTLIAPDLVLTAGHCASRQDCSGDFYIFGYQLDSPDTVIEEFPKSATYACQEVVARSNTDDLDYAVIRLDRPVADRTPVALSRRKPQIGDSAYVLGFPSGLPLKFDGPAEIRIVKKNYFGANFDTFAGSSGSGIFTKDSDELIGVLARGGKDYDYDRASHCYRVHHCPGDDCDGEEATSLDFLFEQNILP